MGAVMGADMTFADLKGVLLYDTKFTCLILLFIIIEWYKFRITAFCINLMKCVTLFEVFMRNMDKW